MIREAEPKGVHGRRVERRGEEKTTPLLFGRTPKGGKGRESMMGLDQSYLLVCLCHCPLLSFLTLRGLLASTTPLRIWMQRLACYGETT